MISNAIFVTGTDTGVGKTYVCGLLSKYLHSQGIKITTQKWIQTGSQHDINSHIQSGKDAHREPYSFKFPASPHLSARMEGRRVDTNKILQSLEKLTKEHDLVLIEGTGGALVPYSTKGLLIDLVMDLRLPTVVVIGNKLGAINHSLLTIEALRARKIPILGLVFNNIVKADSRILRDNISIISRLTCLDPLLTIPYDRSIKNRIIQNMRRGNRCPRAVPQPR